MRNEVFAIPCEVDRYLVYSPLRRTAFVANAVAVNGLARIRNGEPTVPEDGPVRELVEQLHLLEEQGTVSPVQHVSGPFSPSCLTLLLTTGCNLRCSYCYAASGNSPAETMPLALAKRGVDYLVQCATRDGRDRVELAFHGGGEPTLNWDVLTGSLRYARAQAGEVGIQVSAAAATNGVLTDEQIAWCVEHLDGGLSISIDGPPKVHDQHRRTVEGHGSAAGVVRTLHALDDAGYAYGLRVTVTEDHLACLADSVEYLCRQFRPVRILVEPVYCQGRWQDGAAVDSARFVEAFRQARLRAAYHGQTIEFSPVRLDTLSNHFCCVTQDSFVLTPSGDITACYEVLSKEHMGAEHFVFGRWNPQTPCFEIDEQALAWLRSQTVDFRAECQGCYAKWHCAGDCCHKRLHSDHETIGGITDRCWIARELVKDELLFRIHHSGGLVWQGDEFSETEAEIPIGECLS